MKKVLILTLLFPVFTSSMAHAEMLGSHEIKGAILELYTARAPESAQQIPGCSQAGAVRKHALVAGKEDTFGCWIATRNMDTVFITLPGKDGATPTTTAYPTSSFIKP
jgi:hypothetical protein